MKTRFLRELTRIFTNFPGSQFASIRENSRKVPILVFAFFAFFAVNSQAASTVISATLTITNAPALTNATSGQSYTLNGDTRTFTNSVANAATQIRVRTNDSASTILLSLTAQAGAYPFTGIPSLTVSAGTNVTFRASNDTALVITLTPTNWGKVTYVTQTVGTVQTVIRVPQSAEASGVATNLMSQLWDDLDTYSQDRGLGIVDFSSRISVAGRAEIGGRLELDAGFGLHGRYLVATNYTLTTNDIYIGADTRSNTNLILTLPSATSASNLLFIIKDEGGAGSTNAIKIYPASGDRIDTLLTNLNISTNYGGVQLRSRGGTNWNTLATSGGTIGSIPGSISLNGTNVSNPNLTNSATVTYALSGSDIAATANTATVTESLQNKTIDSANNILKMRGYLMLASPFICDGAGASIVTNNNTLAYFGQALFANAGAASTNWVEYRITVPEDIDTSVDLKLERFKFRLGGADTGAHSYELTQAAVADSASYDSPSLSQSVTLSFAGDASGASGDVETISNVTLTNWAGNVTAGRLWVIRLARNGDSDASTVNSYSGPLVISYGISQ